MDKKILCICRHGFSRSVATKMCLNERGYFNVIAVGKQNTDLKTLDMLCKWADIILLAKFKHGDFILDDKKIEKHFSIGEDVWFNPYNKELHEIIDKQLDLIGL
jgi:galactitol-specific phosphotransferase system IIB component